MGKDGLHLESGYLNFLMSSRARQREDVEKAYELQSQAAIAVCSISLHP